MISGRFKTEYLSRHWTNNKSGYCQIGSCHETVGDLEHLLVTCPGLSIVRDRMLTMVLTKTRLLVPLYNFACIITTSTPNIQLQFWTEPFMTFMDWQFFTLCTTVSPLYTKYTEKSNAEFQTSFARLSGLSQCIVVTFGSWKRLWSKNPFDIDSEFSIRKIFAFNIENEENLCKIFAFNIENEENLCLPEGFLTLG